ncbi:MULTISPECIES: endonuclease domain-containing protein [Enorma]|uniref:endonuclease domain-containing protein n=1 Tax=Enorma TaxID=1472762 RepID=UPI001E3A9619|nr:MULTISPECIES: endonuclease domain-containing protein [Enorma]
MDTNRAPSVIVVSHESALRGIRFARCRYAALPWRPLSAREVRDVMARARASARSVDLDELARHGFCPGDEDTRRVHLLASSSASRRRRENVSIHTMGVSPRGATLLEAAPGIFSVSVELAFIQCCATLSFPKALALGYELCGTFSMCEGIWDGWDCDEGSTDPSGYLETEPATTVAALARVVARMPHVRGVKMARSVIANLLDGARSPMEAIVAGVFHMPISLGGIGIKEMQLNRRIDFNRLASNASGMPYTICDAFIPSARVDLEYNGGYHAETVSRIHDENRNRGLNALGITVIALNHDTLRDVEALEAVGSTIFHRAKMRYRDRSREGAARRVRLLNGMREAFGLKPC